MMKKKQTTYEVFVNSVYGSDVVEYDTLEDAIKSAKSWQDCVDEEVIILKKTVEEVAWH